MLDVVIGGVAGVDAGNLAPVQGRRIPERGIERIGAGIRMELKEYPVHLGFDFCRVGGLHQPGDVVLVADPNHSALR